MPTSPASTLSVDHPLSRDDLSFHRYNFQNFVHEALSSKFRELAAVGAMTQSQLAQRIFRDVASVNRSLTNPRNLTLNTISDLMVGMGINPITLLVDELQADEAPEQHPESEDDVSSLKLPQPSIDDPQTSGRPKLTLLKPPRPVHRGPNPVREPQQEDEPRLRLA